MSNKYTLEVTVFTNEPDFNHDKMFVAIVEALESPDRQIGAAPVPNPPNTEQNVQVCDAREDE